MVKRNLFVTACILLAASTSAFSQTSFVFQLPGQSSNSRAIVGWGDDSFSRTTSTANGPAGTFQIIPTPSGNKFYIAAGNGIQSANATLTSITPIAGVTATVNTAAVSPDGKYLLVAADHFYIIDTATDAIVATDAGIPGGNTPAGFAVSRDSSTAWVLSNSGVGGYVAPLNLATRVAGSAVSLPYAATSIVLSPRNLLYISFAANQVDEIDPATLTITAQIPVQALPGPLRFTPDGVTAYFVNRSVCTNCYSLLRLTTATRTVANWPPNDGSIPVSPLFDDVYVAGSSQIFALASTFSTTKLWDVTPTPFAAAPSALGTAPFPGLPINFVSSAALSNERPSARFLYLFIPAASSPLIRWNLATNGIDQQIGASLQTGTSLQFAPIPPQSGATNFLRINSLQTLGVGASSTVSAQVLDSLGRPVFNVPACFSADSTSLAIANPSQVTNSDGWVQTNITAPTLAGTYTVTLGVGPSCLSSAAASTSFTITVGGSGDGGGSSPQFIIVSGNGQLVRQTINAPEPLTVKLTDSTGAPVSGAEVDFQVTNGPGHLDILTTSTDSDGLASADFISGTVNSSVSFQSSTITASSAIGAVTFTETTHNALTDEPNQPTIRISTNPEGSDLTIPQGGRLPGAILATTTSLHAPQFNVPIPNIGIRLADPLSHSQSSNVVACDGSTLGDNLGVSRCDVVVGCLALGTALPQQFNATIAVGELGFAPLRVNITQGAPSLLSIVSGNNQSGNPGTFLNLTARITDGCSLASGNVAVTWSVIQGSGTLQVQNGTTFADGTTSARLVLGSSAGTVQVQVSANGVTPVVFTLTNRTVISGIGLVSGGSQSVNTGEAFPNPLVFAIRDASNNPVSGILVNFSVSGSATLSAASATSNSQGQVQTSVTAGATPGAITVTASFNSFSATANLSSHLLGPQVTANSFVNSASQAVGLTPCGLITVTGSGLAPSVSGIFSGVSPFGPLAYSVAGVSITVNNIAAPIQAVANQNGAQQVNFQAPCELTAGNATVVITVNGATSTTQNVPVFAVQPGIFTYAGPNNKPYGAVIREADGSYVTPSNPAHRGDKLFMVVTGLGQTTPAILTNSAGTGSQNVNLPVVVGISDSGVQELSARYLVGSVGAYIVEFVVPADSPIGPERNLAVAVLTNNATTFVFGNQAFLAAVAQ
ncbi:MAG TPA: Ig-like domain-containing protein [Bryobacteraceae bacterium]